uniref:Multidrug and toxin extrusion protein n=1 Tax=Craspedostauros australis TaxID=1486917 RepID=A0A7R9WVM3_9STRA|mmetsp:Transcript_23242/g.64823  ORF Transcript_23242/g.64823 Transcript_23242/m.64823 type:complete len:575 (+) Transcript_23242:74-1798(+)
MAPKNAEEAEASTETSRLLWTTSQDDSTSFRSDDMEGDESISWDRFSVEVQKQLELAVPSMQSAILNKLPWLISIRFAGGLGVNELTAAALATSLSNIIGMSFSSGLNSATTTLAGQSNGEMTARLEAMKARVGSGTDDSAVPDSAQFTVATVPMDDADAGAGALRTGDDAPLPPMVVFFRALIIQHVILLPFVIWWLSGTKDFLLKVGQAEVIAGMASDYLTALVPAFWGLCLVYTLTTWLQSIGMVDVPLYASCITLALHVPLNWFFIYFLGLGYIGCAVATSCFQVSQSAIMAAYVFGTEHGRQRVLESTSAIAINKTKLTFWPEFKAAISSLYGIIQYLVLAVPGIFAFAELWSSETIVILAGQLSPSPESALGGMSLFQSINVTCFSLSMGIGIAGATRVSNLLGEGKAHAAKFAGTVCTLCTVALTLTLGTILMAVPHTFFPSLFAPGEDGVVDEAAQTIPLLAVYIFADGVLYAFNSTLKGCGKQWISVPVVFFSYWFVGLPLAYYNAFVRNDGDMTCEDDYFCGVVGLLAGTTVGTWLHMLLFGTVVVFGINWKMEVMRAKERLQE